MFFTRFLKPFLFFGGIVTMYAAIYAINPENALMDMNELPYDPQYVVLFRHWGIMVGLMGFFIAASAFKPEWRECIVLYSFVEKLFMVYLYALCFIDPVMIELDLARRFIPFAITDITICTYTVGYWLESRKLRKASA